MLAAALPLLPQGFRQSRNNAIWLRISALLILVISSVLLIISFLNYSNYRKNFLELNLARYLVVTKDLRQTIEAGLNIGLAPAANTRLRPTMRELAQQQSGTHYIAVLDETGNVINQGEVPAHASEQWKIRMRSTDNYWQATNPEHLELGMPFHNNFNLKIGAIVIGYDRVAIENAMADMRRKLIIDTLLALFCAALVVLAGVYWLTRKLNQQLQEVSSVIDRVLTDTEPPQLADKALEAQVFEDVNMFANLSHRVLRTMQDAEQAATSAANTINTTNATPANPVTATKTAKSGEQPA